MLGSTASSMMFKEGTKYLSGVDEAVLKNIEACRDLMNIVRTSMGPNGMFVAVAMSVQQITQID
jgi:T-complex protein 1 subunit theta